MKNFSLSVQIWLVIGLITLSLSLILMFVLPTTLRNFFTEEIYQSIDSAQELVFNQFDGSSYRDSIGPDFFGNNEETVNDIRAVRHFILYEDGTVILDVSTPIEFINKSTGQAFGQSENSKRYSTPIGGQKIFYTITKGYALNRPAYLVSYLSDSYRENLVNTLFSKILSITAIALLLSWVPSLLLARYLSKPLVNLEKRVDKLARRDWNESIIVDRNDEIGKLGHSIEKLRKQLIRQDESEQTFLQNVSHELKTPVMVIRSYSQAIKDNIYPNGDLHSSIDVIDGEAKILEKRISNLLYLTKLDYMTDREIEFKKFSLDRLIQEVIYRFSLKRKDVVFNLDLINLEINGDIDQWIVVIENLLDNQLRYAKSLIDISIFKDSSKDSYVLKMWNDGEPIEDDILDNMFNKFAKGTKGEVGLGLAIVHRILELHGSSISASNLDDGVVFYIYI